MGLSPTLDEIRSVHVVAIVEALRDLDPHSEQEAERLRERHEERLRSRELRGLFLDRLASYNSAIQDALTSASMVELRSTCTKLLRDPQGTVAEQDTIRTATAIRLKAFIRDEISSGSKDALSRLEKQLNKDDEENKKSQSDTEDSTIKTGYTVDSDPNTKLDQEDVAGNRDSSETNIIKEKAGKSFSNQLQNMATNTRAPSNSIPSNK